VAVCCCLNESFDGSQGQLDVASEKLQNLIDEDPRDFRPHLCRVLFLSSVDCGLSLFLSSYKYLCFDSDWILLCLTGHCVCTFRQEIRRR